MTLEHYFPVLVHNDMKVLGLFLYSPWKEGACVFKGKKMSNSWVGLASCASHVYKRIYPCYVLFSAKTTSGDGCRKTRPWHKQDIVTDDCCFGVSVYKTKQKKKLKRWTEFGPYIRAVGTGFWPPICVPFGTAPTRPGSQSDPNPVSTRQGELRLVKWLATFTSAWLCHRHRWKSGIRHFKVVLIISAENKSHLEARCFSTTEAVITY